MLPMVMLLPAWLAAAPQQSVFRTANRSVSIYVTVQSGDRLVTDLPREAFEVFDDGRPQAITLFENGAQPISIVVMIDTSDSMLGNLALVSILGGTLASLVVLGATLVLALGAVRYEWDLDNLVAPVVSTLGDVVTLPALWLAAQLVGIRILTPSLTVVLVVATVAAMALTWRSNLVLLRQI